MKLLFVTNDISFYGASRSLKTLLNALKEYDPDLEIKLIVPKRLLAKNNFSELSDWFGLPVDHIHEFALPFYNNYRGKRNSIFHLLFNVKFLLARKKFYKFLKEERFDLVHLNSLTLINAAQKGFNMVLHVREILENANDGAFLKKKISLLQKMIFIDQATKDAFSLFATPTAIVMNNPFSMLGIAEARNSEPYKALKALVGNRVCVAAIGKVTHDKGADFLVETLIDLNADIVLLIVGGGQKNYTDALKTKAGDNIIFIDESPDVNYVYAVADYVIRGEGYHCIGRTVYEALYSGLGVILPGEISYYKTTMNEFGTFENCILSYEPRNVQSLKTILGTLKKKHDGDQQLLTNTVEYIKAFLNFSV